MGKVEELQALARATTSTPETYWSAVDFERQASDAKDWRIRAEDESGISRSGLTFSQVLEQLRMCRYPVVVQEMLHSAYSGVTYFAEGGFTFTEWVRGDSTGLLRGGDTGSRWVMEGDSCKWNSGASARGVFESWMQGIGSLHVSTPTLLEWIVVPSGGFYWVDLKVMLPGFLAEVPAAGSGWTVSRGTLVQGSDYAFDRPSLGTLDLFKQGPPREVLYSKGSPLAHACTRLHLSGASVAVLLP